jgi:hypothetical protein
MQKKKRFILSDSPKTWLATSRMGRVGFSDRVTVFLIVTISSSDVGSIKPSMQWISGELSQGIR